MSFLKTKISWPILAVIGIFIGAIVLRLFLISNFDYYSDSYFFELTAKFIKENLSLDGFLGQGGEYLKPLFYKFGYPIFIAFTDLFANNLELSSHIVSYVFGILSIPLFWLLVKNYSNRIKLISLLIFSFSFTLSTVSGFILSETTGLFFLLLSLVLLQRKSKWWASIAIGLMLIARIEFIFLLIPVVYYLSKSEKKPSLVLPAVFGFVIFALTALFFVFRANNPAEIFGKTVLNYYDILLRYIPYILVGISVFVSYLLLKKKRYWPALILVFISVICGMLAWQNITPRMNLNFNGILAFLRFDFLLIPGLVGIFFLKEKKTFVPMIIILLVLYFPRGDFRFFAYLVPFLAVGSAFVFDYLLTKFKRYQTVFIITGSILLIVSILLSLLPWHPKVNYESVLADQIKLELAQKNLQNQVILAYAPEPIFLKTGLPAYKFWARPSDWENLDPNQEVVLVLDEAVYQDSLANYDKLFGYFADKQISYFKIDVPYYNKAIPSEFNRPVILILTNISELKKVLDLKNSTQLGLLTK